MVCNKNDVKLVKDVPRIKFLYHLWVSRFPSDREYDTGFYCKTEQAWKCSIVNGKQRVFFCLCCTSNLTPLSCVPARNRTIVIFSWQHHDVMYMVRHKTRNWKFPCTIMTTERGSDVLDKTVKDYTVWDQQGPEICSSDLKHTQPIAISKHYNL